MAKARYATKKWVALKKRILARPASITDDERRCVECEVRSLEDTLRRYRAQQAAR